MLRLMIGGPAQWNVETRSPGSCKLGLLRDSEAVAHRLASNFDSLVRQGPVLNMRRWSGGGAEATEDAGMP